MKKGSKVDPLTSKDRTQFNRKTEKVNNLKPVVNAKFHTGGNYHSNSAEKVAEVNTTMT